MIVVTKVFIGFVAALFAMFGVIYAVSPEPLAELAGLQADASGRTDIRATYGGFQIGFAIYLTGLGLIRDNYRGALMAICIVMASVGLCRLLGVVWEQSLSGFNTSGLVTEFVITAIGVYLYRRVAAVGSGQ
jgi:hypothetical protein